MVYKNPFVSVSMLTFLATFSVFSQVTKKEFNKEVRKTYERINSQAHILCEQKALSKKQIKKRVPFIQKINVTPRSESSYANGELSREFSLTNLEDNTSFDFDVKYFVEQSSGLSKFEFNLPQANLSFTGTTAVAGYFSLTAGGVKPTIKEVGQDKFNSYSLNNLICRVIYGRSDEVKINFNQPLHISVHPHTGYEKYRKYGKRLAPVIEPILEDKKYNHLVLLDHHEYHQFKNLKFFLENGDTTIKVRDEEQPNGKTIVKGMWFLAHGLPASFDQSIEDTLLVAPYGEIRYLPSEDSKSAQFPEILYTGGFHNYCMTFNLIELGKLFVLSDAQNDLNVTFKTSAIILQRNGYQKSISGKQKNKELSSISLKRKHLKDSQHLNDFISKFPNDGKSYLNKHIDSIGKELKSLRKAYSSLELEYDYKGIYSKKVTIQGTGHKPKAIKLNYIE